MIKHKVGILFTVIFLISNKVEYNLSIDLGDYTKNETYSAQGVLNIVKFLGTGRIQTLLEDGTVPKFTTTTTTQRPVPKCGIKKSKQNELIVRGVATKPGDWPWHAALYKISKRRQSNYICGGTLLSETRVLTAGHCVVEAGAVVLPERLFATLGKFELIGSNINSQEKAVFEIILHPEFEGNPLKNDISLLKLLSKVTYTLYVQPICLWTSPENFSKESLYGKYGNIVGWGFTEDDELSTDLKLATLPVATDLECLRSNPNFFGTYLNNRTFCVGQRDGINACNGDSGGGFFFSETFPDGNGQEIWYVRGIVSLSVSRQDLPLCDPNEYTLFTDVNQHMNFITSNL